MWIVTLFSDSVWLRVEETRLVPDLCSGCSVYQQIYRCCGKASSFLSLANHYNIFISHYFSPLYHQVCCYHCPPRSTEKYWISTHRWVKYGQTQPSVPHFPPGLFCINKQFKQLDDTLCDMRMRLIHRLVIKKVF